MKVSCSTVWEQGARHEADKIQDGRAHCGSRRHLPLRGSHIVTQQARERELFTDDLLVRIHLINEMILADRPCAMGT